MEMVQKKFTVNFLVSEHIRKNGVTFLCFLMEMVQKMFTVNFLVSEHIRKKWCDFSLFPNGNGSKKVYCKFSSVGTYS
jgi:hypothetical protein